MKKLLALLCAMVVFSAGAQTTNWYVDGTLYQTSSCTSGDDVTPPTAPAKHGYTFVGWYDSDVVVGTWAQSGTPSPTNPIEPTFYQNGNLILRAIGTGGNLIADTYNTETDKIIRRVGVKVLDGTESWTYSNNRYQVKILDALNSAYEVVVTHGQYDGGTVKDTNYWGLKNSRLLACYADTSIWTTVEKWQQYLADQYAAGTPVTVYYPLATPVEETYTPNSNQE